MVSVDRRAKWAVLWSFPAASRACLFAPLADFNLTRVRRIPVCGRKKVMTT